ncbi:MAG: hypothetical protein I8H90_22660 [Burkholderiales bacterium]|nr:hypothetical protein [Burkholderiales bacterium]MBH2071717.1 hypothetical protein [Burkholderiales bacterium]
MINRLYTVSATLTAVIMATSEREAEIRFKSDFGEIKDQPIDAVADGEIRTEADLPDDWAVDCLPYGPRDNALTIGEFLDVLPPPAVRDTKTADMFVATPAAGEKA